jgi:hypothetical protein
MDEEANILIVPCKVVTAVCRWPTVVCKFDINALKSSMEIVAPEFCWHRPEITRTLLGGELCKYRIRSLPPGEASGCVISRLVIVSRSNEESEYCALVLDCAPGLHCWVAISMETETLWAEKYWSQCLVMFRLEVTGPVTYW